MLKIRTIYTKGLDNFSIYIGRTQNGMLACRQSTYASRYSAILTVCRKRVEPVVEGRIELGDGALLPLRVSLTELRLQPVDRVLRWRRKINI